MSSVPLLARGRFDHGVYASVEFSSAYEGLAPGQYLVIVASGEQDSTEVRATLDRVKVHFPEAQIKSFPVYVGCVH